MAEDTADAILRELAEWCQWDDPSDCGDCIECPLCKQMAIRGEAIDHDSWCPIGRARALVRDVPTTHTSCL